MIRSTLFRCLALISVLTLGAIPLRASDMVGVYAVIEKVVFEPDATNPTAAQIWGAFSVAVPRQSNGTQSKPPGSFENAALGSGVYAAVQKGYLYYTCAEGKEQTCRAEWADLKSVAGKNDIVGFGARYGPSNGRIRKAAEKPASPDLYPINFGVVRMGRMGTPLGQTRIEYPELEAALRAAIAK